MPERMPPDETHRAGVDQRKGYNQHEYLREHLYQLLRDEDEPEDRDVQPQEKHHDDCGHENRPGPPPAGAVQHGQEHRATSSEKRGNRQRPGDQCAWWCVAL